MEFTKEEVKEYITGALRMRTGDNLERCVKSFGHLSGIELEEEYGGTTKGKMLAGYERERRLYKAARIWVGL